MLICCIEGCEFNNLISNDEHIRCWLCDEYAHAKCAGITNNVVEIIEGRSGLKWTCENCRVIKSQMGRFMKQTRTEITELFKEIRAVHDKLAKLESHLTSHPQVPAFPVDADFRSNTCKNTPPTFGDTNDDKEVEETESSNVKHNATGMHLVKIWHHNAAPVVLPLHPNPDTLIAVPPMKAVFVSRLITSTTEDALKHYIVAKLSHPNPDDIIVRKIYNKQRRKIASFKVMAPDFIYYMILNPGFWPEHIIVHEFIKKSHLQTNDQPIFTKYC
ncbi:uncharacterized protein LOC26526751 isoform X2 [Drosophila erecta]|uniref:uncharacterized protein LOC26526751 isoform X2 n=1 Tax=Drosophila erecta TaxID=7220 RepID=UPI000732BA18|nr:uncharacterized protein LOC26526751 isoform X2 [Drosophila erecta]KQS38653.1 uncharacterized protein Dere_GG26927 [Drosophila erecta]